MTAIAATVTRKQAIPHRTVYLPVGVTPTVAGPRRRNAHVSGRARLGMGGTAEKKEGTGDGTEETMTSGDDPNDNVSVRGHRHRHDADGPALRTNADDDVLTSVVQCSVCGIQCCVW